VTFAPTDSPPARKSRGPLIVGIIIAAIVIFGVGAAALQIYTNLLWFRSVNATSVYTRVLTLRIALFVIFGLIMALGIWFSLWLPYRLRPPMRPTPDQIALERYRQAFDPARRFVFVAVPALFGLLAGASAAAQWRSWLLYLHGVPFPTVDAQFHKNVGFYVYDYPIYRAVLGFALTMLLLGTLGTVVVSYLYGAIRLQAPPGHRMYRATQVIVSVQLGLFFLVKAGDYYLDRFALEITQGSLITGLNYTAAHAVLPGLNLLVGAAIIVALLFFANIFLQRWTIPVVGVISLLGVSIIVGGIYPALVQRFSVQPSAQSKEAPYISRNITATRAAYGLDRVQTSPYSGNVDISAATLKASADTLRNIRIMDPALLSPTFQQKQGQFSYYTFPDPLSIDRYTLNGQLREAVVAARDIKLSGLSSAQQSWISNHIVYTHGYGLVAAYGNTATTSGDPKFFEQNLPSVGDLTILQPRIYFGLTSPNYSIVGAPAGSKPVELDYPLGQGQTKNNTYHGSGGVPIGSLINRIAYALRLSDLNILLSSSVNADSRLLYIRQPLARLEQVAPWLTVDSSPYPSVINGRIVWVLDGYTTTNNYPGSTPSTWTNATLDSVNATSGSLAGQPPQQINYIRNSIKATVDAYDGTVTLYAWDKVQADPLLKTWEAAFPGLVKPYSEIPAGLLQHVRYPQDMFKVQRQIYAKYHVTNANTFYAGQDIWAIPDDPTRGASGIPQPPYYLELQLPDPKAAPFQLTSTFAPRGSTPRLAAFMSVTAEAGPDYGTIRVLKLRSSSSVSGPSQVQNEIESDPIISKQLSLWRSGGSQVDFGNMLALPVGGGFLYVEPLFIRATTGASSYPLLGQVVASLGTTPQMAGDLPTVLAKVFGSPLSNGGTTGGGGGGGKLTAQQQLAAALASMQAAIANADAALARQDWTAYGIAQKELQNALAHAVIAQQRLTSPTAKPTVSPSVAPSHSATPTPSPKAKPSTSATPSPSPSK